MTDIEKVISGLEKTVSHFKFVQNAQRENGKYVSASFKEYENACLNAIDLLKNNMQINKDRRMEHDSD